MAVLQAAFMNHTAVGKVGLLLLIVELAKMLIRTVDSQYYKARECINFEQCREKA